MLPGSMGGSEVEQYYQELHKLNQPQPHKYELKAAQIALASGTTNGLR